MTDTNSPLELPERRDEDARRVLREAAEYISEHGWTQGDYRDEAGAVCALGAIWASQGGLDREPYLFNNQVCDEAYLLLRQQLRIDARFYDVSIWNDAPERTAEDVILTMKRAAE